MDKIKLAALLLALFGGQARSVIEGNQADVVTLAMA